MRITFLPLVLAAALGAAPVLAEKPDHAGGGKHGNKHEWKAEKKADKAEKKADKAERKAEKHARKHDDDRGPRHGAYFDDRHRDSVRRYYAAGGHGGKGCPPGLARKNNGCMPPGQAKKWAVGKPLPRDVVIYTVPQPILVTLPPPPPRHRYVRVAGDILLIAIGTSLVVDGINGLLN